MSEHLTNIVVVPMIHRDGKIYIARRAATKKTFPNRIEVPGGHLDPGETLQGGLRREVKEETGLDVEVGELIDAFTYESDGVLKVELIYMCAPRPGQEPKLNPVDHSEGMWIGPDEIAKFDKEDEETAALRKAFKILEGEK